MANNKYKSSPHGMDGIEAFKKPQTVEGTKREKEKKT